MGSLWTHKKMDNSSDLHSADSKLKAMFFEFTVSNSTGHAPFFPL